MEDNIRGPSFPIVGIGASAGGLNALHCFLGALPREFGFAVVFIQHLSSKHKSLLPELLHNRRPDIDIKEISDRMKVLPGKVYLCPPGKAVMIREATFHVSLPSEDHVYLPIDEFFVALGDDAGEHAIAVIFSGAGTDGARGIQAVRDAGGTVFVQEPATAEFPPMPLAAIGTGRADFVLPPEDIAREILKLRGAVPAGAAKDITPDQFETFYRLIHEKTGYRFNHYKKNVVGRRIRRRMYLRGISSVQDYVEMVAERDSEAANLASDLMIGVTSFFRDQLAWKALKKEVIRKLAALDDQPVRVWTPACATGEEAYSIAMMFRNEFELSGKKREVQVFATDLNDQALEKAREGTYPGSITADVPPDYMKKFFTCSEDGNSVIIGKEIRESVVIAKQDLLIDPPFSRLDLIICRNFMIYLEPDAQEKCIALFHYALKDGGYLFLGNAESAGRNKTLFKSLGQKKCRIYQKTEDKPPARLSLKVPFASERAQTAPSRAPAEYQQSINDFVQQELLEESGPAAVAINQHYDILYNNGPTNRYLRQPRGAPTQNLLGLLPENLQTRMRGALYRAAQEARPVSIRAIIPNDDRKRQVTLRMSKLRDNLFLVIFREEGGVAEEAEVVSSEAAPVDESALLQLESELSATRADIQSHIEQLKSLNEELQSSNEELQAANEELETSREELQSLNEELITVNSQLQSKIEEQEETNNDLNNFLASTNMPTVFLDTQFRVKRFTPAMSRLLKLIPSDVGRPIIDMSQDNLGPDLIADAQAVLDNLVPMKKDIAVDGNWYIRATLPYRTTDNRIEGVVITYSDVTEIKKAEAIQGRLAAIVESAEDAIISKDLKGIITTWNVGAENIFGYTAEEAVGRHISFLAPPGDKDDSREILLRIAAGEHIEHFETLHRRKDGTVIPVSLTFSAIRDENGKVVGVSKIAHDITERKKAEEALRESEEQFRHAIEDAPIPVIMHAEDGAVLQISSTWTELTGYKLSDLPTLDVWLNRAYGEGADVVRDHVRALFKGDRRSIGLEFPVRTIDGKTRYWSFSASSPGALRDGRRFIVGMAVDITERKKTEERIIRAKEEWERTFDSVPDMIAIIDNDHKIVRVNESMAKRLGRKPEECIGMKCYEAVHGTTVPIGVCPHCRTLKDNREHVQEVHEESLGMDLLVSTTPLFDEQGKMIGSVHVAHDITERKRAEREIAQRVKELRVANEELTRFTRASVGRELRMIEMKKEINELCAKAGMPPRYSLDFAKEGR